MSTTQERALPFVAFGYRNDQNSFKLPSAPNVYIVRFPNRQFHLIINYAGSLRLSVAVQTR